MAVLSRTCRPLLIIIIQQRPRAEEAVVVAHAVVTVQRAGVVASVGSSGEIMKETVRFIKERRNEKTSPPLGPSLVGRWL